MVKEVRDVLIKINETFNTFYRDERGGVGDILGNLSSEVDQARLFMKQGKLLELSQTLRRLSLGILARKRLSSFHVKAGHLLDLREEMIIVNMRNGVSGYLSRLVVNLANVLRNVDDAKVKERLAGTIGGFVAAKAELQKLLQDGLVDMVAQDKVLTRQRGPSRKVKALIKKGDYSSAAFEKELVSKLLYMSEQIHTILDHLPSNFQLYHSAIIRDWNSIVDWVEHGFKLTGRKVIYTGFGITGTGEYVKSFLRP